jgi:uncharacterized membrane protein
MLKKLTISATLFIVIFSTVASTGAQENVTRVHGTVYDWFTLEPLKNCIVEVNTVPKQVDVTENGEYSFKLPPGKYIITANFFRGKVLLYHAEENLTIPGTGGDFVLDLIAFPAFDENEMPLFENLIHEFETQDRGTNWIFLAIGIAAAVIIIVGIYYVKMASKKKPAKVEVAKEAAKEPAPVRVIGLPSDLQEIVDKIRKSGGRMNQLELRKMLPYSEAKVSLMVADLEDRGLIRKIKKGRGNILILKE